MLQCQAGGVRPLIGRTDWPSPGNGVLGHFELSPYPKDRGVVLSAQGQKQLSVEQVEQGRACL